MEQTNLKYSIIADYYSEHYNELKLYVMSRSLPAETRLKTSCRIFLCDYFEAIR